MKINTSEKQSIGVRRTLCMVEESFINLLMKKSFDEIQVAELCEEAMISRATFYHYFYDKFDVMSWFLDLLQAKIYPDVDVVQNHRKHVDHVCDTLFDYMQTNQKTVDAIVRHNPKGTTFYRTAYDVIINSFRRTLLSCTESWKYEIPLEIVAQMDAYAMIVVTEFVFIDKHPVSREKYHDYINDLLI